MRFLINTLAWLASYGLLFLALGAGLDGDYAWTVILCVLAGGAFMGTMRKPPGRRTRTKEEDHEFPPVEV